MGVSGELLTIYAALPYIQKTGLYSITLPNKYNFSFDYYTFLILTMVSYIPCKCVFYCVYIVFTCSKISTLLPQTDSYWNVSPVHSVPAALLPHVAAEKEGSGSRGRVQQSGINMMPGLHTTWTEHMEERGEGGEKKKRRPFPIQTWLILKWEKVACQYTEPSFFFFFLFLSKIMKWRRDNF